MLKFERASAPRELIRAFVLSLAALSVPVAGAFLVPEKLSDYEALLWLLALIPAFLLAYHRGWNGVATSLATGMAVLSVTYALSQMMGRHVPPLLFGVVIFYIFIALMVGMLAERLHRDVEREQEDASKFTDALSGLPNRKQADLQLEIEFGAAQRGRALSIMYLDLDDFAEYNARHGSAAGDEVLRFMGTVLKKHTRRMNLSARYADDEFLCIMGGTEEDGAVVFFSRIQESLRAAPPELQLPSVSGGIAAYRPNLRNCGEMVVAAIEALGRAKADGAGRVRVHGRTLTLLAPAASPESHPPRHVDPPVPVIPESRGAGRKALIVVDDQPVRALLSQTLAEDGFKIAQVGSLVDGVQCLSVEYDVLITDVSLVDGVGSELVRAAKLRWPSMQVIGLAEVTDGAAAIDALNAGVDRFVRMPPDLHALRQHLTDLLSRRDRLVASVLENRQLTLEFEAQRVEAVNALRRSEQEYRSVVQSLQEVVFRTNTAGEWTLLNWAWTEITGYAVEESLGRRLLEFVHEEDRGRIENRFAQLLTGELEEAHGELRVVNKDGSTRWVGVRARRVFAANGTLSGASGTLDDLTHRKLAEERLRRNEATSRALLNALPDVVYGINRHGVFVSYGGSEESRALADHYVGRAIEEVFAPDVARQYRSCIAQLFETRQVQICEYRVMDAGEPQQFEARFAVTGTDEIVVIVRNMSEQRRLQEQLRQSQKLEAIGRLAGGLAHDFNNLLTVVQGNAHLLIEEFPEHPIAVGLAQQITVAADRGAELVKQLLAFGRKQRLQPRLLNLNTVVTSVHGMLPRLIGEDVLIHVDLDPHLGLVKADPGQMEQVIVSLAAFAKERMREGGNLYISTRNANGNSDPELQAQVGKSMVALVVMDDGAAIAEESRARVFEPFFGPFTDGTASKLGLAAVYGIMTQSGGAIQVDDAPQGGARFQLFLQRADT